MDKYLVIVQILFRVLNFVNYCSIEDMMYSA